MSSRTSCTKHAPNTQFFVLHWDFLYITKNDYAQAASLRVLETKTNDRITYLLEFGKSKEEITEEDCWLLLRWHDFVVRTLHLYEARSFQNALAALVKAKAGFVKRRYVKINADGQVICNEETGLAIAYPDIKSARHDLEHRGEIVNQFLLNTKAVNKAIDRIAGSGGGDDDNGGDGDGDGGGDDDDGGDGDGDGGGDDDNGGDGDGDGGGDDDDGGDGDGDGGGDGPGRPGGPAEPGETSPSSAEGEEKAGPDGEKKVEASATRQPHGGVTSSQTSEQSSPRPTIQQDTQNCESAMSAGRDVPPRYSEGTQNYQPSPRRRPAKAGNFAREDTQKGEEAAQNCGGKARKIASNNNNYNQESSRIGEESTVSASRAVVVDPSLFEKIPWTRQAILDLLALYLEPLQPLNEKAPQQWQELAKKMHQDWEEAVSKLAADSYLALRGLPYLARGIAYMTDPGSPCNWLAFFRGKYPNAPVRPWHIAKSVVRCGQEMEERNWWPTGTEPARPEDVSPADDGQAQASPANTNEKIDLADLAGTAPEERQGMDLEAAKALEAHIRRCHPDYWVDRRRIDPLHRDRGFAVEFWYADGCFVRIYSPEQWDLVLDESSLLGSLEFVQRLTAALHGSQAA